jgi:hypothetical protein
MSDHILHTSIIHKSLEYKDLKTTMIYKHVLNRVGQNVLSPANTTTRHVKLFIRQKVYFTTCLICHKNFNNEYC